MAREDFFETAKERPKGNLRRLLSSGFFARYKPQIVVGALVVALLAGFFLAVSAAGLFFLAALAVVGISVPFSEPKTRAAL